MRAITYEYFEWLCSLVKIREQKGYWYDVLWALQATEFDYRHPKDVNREYDGLALRDEFWAVYGPYRGITERDMAVLDDVLGGCTALEMMVALARRGENDIMHDPELGDRSDKWFWIMVDNLDLGRFAYPGALDLVENRENLSKILSGFGSGRGRVGKTGERSSGSLKRDGRRSKGHGRLDLFGLKKEGINLDVVEIWDQMCAFFGQFF